MVDDANEALKQSMEFHTQYYKVSEKLYEAQQMLSGILAAIHEATSQDEYSQIMNTYLEKVQQFRASMANDMISPKNIMTAIGIEANTAALAAKNNTKIANTAELVDVFDEMFGVVPEQQEETHEVKRPEPVIIDTKINDEDGSITEFYSDGSTVTRYNTQNDNGYSNKTVVSTPNGYLEILEEVNKHVYADYHRPQS